MDKNVYAYISTTHTVKILEWNSENNISIDALSSHSDTINDIIQLMNGNIASCSNDKTIKIWEKVGNRYKCSKTLTGTQYSIHKIIEYTPGCLMSCERDGTIKLWNL